MFRNVFRFCPWNYSMVFVYDVIIWGKKSIIISSSLLCVCNDFGCTWEGVQPTVGNLLEQGVGCSPEVPSHPYDPVVLCSPAACSLKWAAWAGKVLLVLLDDCPFSRCCGASLCASWKGLLKGEWTDEIWLLKSCICCGRGESWGRMGGGREGLYRFKRFSCIPIKETWLEHFVVL